MRISGLSEIALQFDAMLIDQFGVIHDGQRLYRGARDVMAKLHALRIPVIIMTNSGKRAQASIDRTVRLGIPRAHFQNCVSSGEVGYQSLTEKRAYLIGRSGEEYGFDNIERVAYPKDANVILILGSNAPETSLDDYENLLRGLTIPALNCNPDKLMFSADGFHPGPGAIADLYERLGGTVKWVGKPYPAIYQHALGMLGRPSRVLCIGDSAEHDVAGGRGAGLSTLLVQQGISASVAEHDIDPYPDYIMSSFQWDG
jgi:HAD superfamily hydrolase (TIGR01459 family)